MPWKEASAALGQSKPYSKAVILVVDDEPLLRALAADILEEAGFEVLEASSADDAIDILERHDDVRLLFTDVNMPGSMDGACLAHRVSERWPTIAIIVTSGKMSAGDLALPDQSRFVPKPYRNGDLLTLVRSANL